MSIMDIPSMQSSIQDALDDIQSTRSSTGRKTRALAALEYLLTLVYVSMDSDGSLNGFLRLQDTFECNVPSRLLSWISLSTYRLEGLASKGPGDQETSVLSSQLVQAMCIIQGVALNHLPSKNFLGRKYCLDILLDLLSTCRHLSSSPTNGTNTPDTPSRRSTTPSSNPTRTSTPITATTATDTARSIQVPLSAVVLDTLMCILVDSSVALRAFEGCGGLQAVVKMLKAGGTPRDIRMKCLEFLYFYLMDESPPPPPLTETSGSDLNLNSTLPPPSPSPHPSPLPLEQPESQPPSATSTTYEPTSCSHTHEFSILPSSSNTKTTPSSPTKNATETAPSTPTPIISRSQSMKAYTPDPGKRSLRPSASSSFTSSTFLNTWVSRTESRNASPFDSDISNSSGTTATTPEPEDSSRTSRGRKVFPRTPSKLLLGIGRNKDKDEDKSSEIDIDMDYVPASAQKSKFGSIKSKVRGLRELSTGSRSGSRSRSMPVLLEGAGRKSLFDRHRGLGLGEYGNGNGGVAARSAQEKKEILSGMLGNVDAIVEGVRKAGIWGLG